MPFTLYCTAEGWAGALLEMEIAISNARIISREKISLLVLFLMSQVNIFFQKTMTTIKIIFGVERMVLKICQDPPPFSLFLGVSTLKFM